MKEILKYRPNNYVVREHKRIIENLPFQRLKYVREVIVRRLHIVSDNKKIDKHFASEYKKLKSKLYGL